MSVIGYSMERSSRTHLDQLRREAFAKAQVRRARVRTGSRIAAFLRAVAARLEQPDRTAAGPWREDFHRRRVEHA